jgi:hypothetical protein
MNSELESKFDELIKQGSGSKEIHVCMVPHYSCTNELYFNCHIVDI